MAEGLLTKQAEQAPLSPTEWLLMALHLWLRRPFSQTLLRSALTRNCGLGSDILCYLVVSDKEGNETVSSLEAFFKGPGRNEPWSNNLVVK